MTIFVNVVAIESADVMHTVSDLCTKARYADALRVCISVKDCAETLREIEGRVAGHPNLVLKTYDLDGNVSYSEMVRNAQMLIKNEEYYLQIKPHQRFVLHWDVICLHMIGQCFKSEYTQGANAVLTTAGVHSAIFENDLECIGDSAPRILDFDYAEGDRLELKRLPIDNYKVRTIPMRTHLMCCDFVFCRSAWAKNVRYPVDMHVADEHVVMSIASFIAGWEMFNAYDVLSYRDESSGYDDDCEATRLGCVEACSAELFQRRTLEEYKYYSGYNLETNEFVERNNDFVRNENVWKSLYAKDVRSVFSTHRRGTCGVVVTVDPTPERHTNHGWWAKLNRFTHVSCKSADATQNDIVEAFSSEYDVIIIVRCAIFTKGQISIRNTLADLKMKLATCSYMCSTGNVSFIGAALLERVEYMDLCEPHDTHVYRKHYFMCADPDAAEQHFREFNRKHVLA